MRLKANSVNFPVPRAEQRAVVTLDTPEFLAFLKADQSGEVGFMIHCETPGSTLVHGFASSQQSRIGGSCPGVDDERAGLKFFLPQQGRFGEIPDKWLI